MVEEVAPRGHARAARDAGHQCPAGSPRQRGGTLKETGGITVNHASPAGSLLARVLMEDPATGYSSSLRFFDPKKAKSNMLQGTGLRLGEAGGSQLTPVIVARNVGAADTTVSGRVPYTDASGQAASFALPALTLAPGETKLVDTSGLRGRAVEGVATAGLEFEYTGEPGGVIMSAQSLSGDGDLSFQVPMWDIKAQRSSTGGYPWAVEGDRSTFVYIKNVTDHRQEYVLEILSEGAAQPYRPGLKGIEAGQTVALDLRKLRDEQVPDAQGNIIPPGAARGQIQWSMRGIDQLPLIGRSEQVDTGKRWSFSYACMNCCGDQPWGWGIGQSPSTIINFGQAGFAAFEGMTTCYGWQHGPYQVMPSNWWVEPNDYPEFGLASIDGGGWLASDDSGEGTVFCEYQTYWVSGDGLSCWQNPYTNLLSAGLAILSPVDFIDATTAGDSAGFPPPPANSTNLNVECTGARFKIRVRFRPPFDSDVCCNNPVTSRVDLFDESNNMFAFANDPVTDTFGWAFFGNENPPYVDIFLRRRSGGTQNRVGIRVGGVRTNGTSYSGNAVLRLQCAN